jgi:cell division septation protein DedD
VPGWGTFYLSQRETRFETATGAVFPAGKYIGFNPNSAGSPAVLQAAVVRAKGGNLESAEAWVRRKVQNWQQTIDEGKAVALKGLGTFIGNHRFSPEQSGPIDAASFGFSSILLHRLAQPSALESKVVASLKVVSDQRKNSTALWRKAAVAAAVTALVTLGVFQSELPTQAAGWFAPQPTEAIEIEPGEISQEAAVTPEEVDIKDAPVVVAPVKAHTHYVVVGSFKEAQNAENLAADLKARGLEVELLKGSLLKVGIGFGSRAEATAELAQIKANVNAHAWIYARR